MVTPNPKKEFLVNYPISEVKEAIHKSIASDPEYYILVKDDTVLNQVVIHQKGRLLDPGYHIDFDLRKVSDNETNVLIEVSRNLGTINTVTETQIANNSLKSITDIFSAFLAGNVNEQGKPNLPKPTGCAVIITAGALAALLMSFI